jgi:hypothetical protein
MREPPRGLLSIGTSGSQLLLKPDRYRNFLPGVGHLPAAGGLRRRLGSVLEKIADKLPLSRPGICNLSAVSRDVGACGISHR